MKQKLLLLLLAAVLPLMTFTACTANPNATASENAANAWNQPATQQELQILTQIGTTALNTWASSQVTKGRHENKEHFIATQTSLAVKKYPQIPRAKINAKIRAQLADK